MNTYLIGVITGLLIASLMFSVIEYRRNNQKEGQV